MLLVWSGPALVVITFVSMIGIARFIPPPPAYLSAEQVAAIYAARSFPIIFGLFLTITAGALLIPFSAAIAMGMWRIEGARPIMALTQFGGGATGAIILIAAYILMIAAAFDPTRPVEITKALHDTGWLMLLVCYSPFCVQYVAIAIVSLQDTSAHPLFPRWVGYYNIWLAISFIPTGTVAFFKTGPFTWHGLIGFWVPTVTYGNWFLIMFFMLRRAARREVAEVQSNDALEVAEVQPNVARRLYTDRG
jgi:hypothetical protein